MKVVSASSLILIGCPNFPITSNSLCSLYNPIVVTYGFHKDPVAKLFNSKVILVSLGGIILVNLALLIACYMAFLTQLLKKKERIM